MKTLKITASIIVTILLGVLIFFWPKKFSLTDQKVPQEDSIIGCYVAVISNDVYTLAIDSQEGEAVSGALEFKNYQKDSSKGLFVGTYKDNILLGDYRFQSEGMQSVMQVIFKKSGDNFIRGYGDLNTEGTRFTNLNTITYDESSPLAVFKESPCPTMAINQGTL